MVRYVIVVKVNMSSKRKCFIEESDNKRLKNDDLFDDDTDLEQEMCDIADDIEMWSEDEEFEQLMCKAVDDYESNQHGGQQNVQGIMVFHQVSLKIVFEKTVLFQNMLTIEKDLHHVITMLNKRWTTQCLLSTLSLTID